MDGSVRQSSRRAHLFFGLFTLSLFSFIAFFSRPAVPLYHVHYSRRDLQPFARAPPSSSIPPSNNTLVFAPLLGDAPSLSPVSSVSSSSFSPSSTSPSSTAMTSSTTSTTTTTSTRTSSTASPRPTLPTPTTTTLTSSTVSTPVSSTTTTYFLMSDVTPSTTFHISEDDSTTSTTVASSVDPSSTATSASKATSSSTQFWDNKGAVAATFVIIGLLGLAFAIMIITTMLKRQRAKREAIIDAEFMPNYQEPKSRSPSPSPSISSSPLDPFKSREVVHVHVPTDVPASSEMSNLHTRNVPTIHLTPPSAFVGNSRYLLPSQLQVPSATNAAGQPNKSEMRVSTQSGYQPSFDSFYGAYD